MRLRRYDPSVLKVICNCDPLDDVCKFTEVGGQLIAHHDGCPFYRAARQCQRQFELWLFVSMRFKKVGRKRRSCRCCRYCCEVGNQSLHCNHCPVSAKFIEAQDQAVSWKSLLTRISIGSTQMRLTKVLEDL